jgi:hypothetical protein
VAAVEVDTVDSRLVVHVSYVVKRTGEPTTTTLQVAT